MTILLRQKPLPQVVRQIVQRDNGAWFDPEDLSTMFQDAAGTTPVTALEQPVGRWLDKSGNGNHATQLITAARPTLSARYNLLTKTEDFADAAWNRMNVSAVSNYALSPSGTMTASLITNTGVGGYIHQNDNFSSANTKTISIYVKQSSTNWIRVVIASTWVGANAAGYYFNTATGEVGQSVVGGVGYRNVGSPQTSVGMDGWVRITFTVSGPSESMRPVISIANNNGDNNGVAGSTCLVWGADIRAGIAIPNYQQVNTATDYDSVGFPKYIKAEGVDDHFVLPYLGLYNNASCSIITSHSSSSQAANGVIVSEASSTDADTKYLPYRQLASAGNVDSYIAADNAAVILNSTGAAYSGTKENIIESIIDSGTSIETYRSGVLLSNEPYTRSATLTLNNTTLFGSVSTTNTNFLNTKLYGLIITKSNLSARDRSLCETYLKSKVQVLQV